MTSSKALRSGRVRKKASRKQCQPGRDVDLELEKVRVVKEEEKKIVEMKLQRRREEQERMIEGEKYKAREGSEYR